MIKTNDIHDKFKYNLEEEEEDEDDESGESNESEEQNQRKHTRVNTPRHRQKRAHPLLVPILAGAAGTSMGFAIGMATQGLSKSTSSTDVSALNNIHVKILKEHAVAIQDLRINHIQATNVLNNVVDRLQSFEMTIMGSFDGVTSITMAMDLKALNEQLKTISQLTLLKYTTALIAAADGRTSPYVLSQKDLDQLVQNTQRLRNIKLSHDLDAIKTTVTIEDNTIIFYLEIPIIDDKKLFNLYTVSALPVFMNNETYLPNLDSNHIAINNDGDKFTVLSDIQLSACLDKPPRCSSNTAITPIHSEISCVAIIGTKSGRALL